VREYLTVEGPTELDHGYFELRVNWGGQALLDMTGEQLDTLQQAIATLRSLECPEHEHTFASGAPGGVMRCTFDGCTRMRWPGRAEADAASQLPASAGPSSHVGTST
jgi:hypothetical protein